MGIDLDNMSEDEIKKLHEITVETSPSPEQEKTEEAETKEHDEKKREREAKEDLLFQTANTWAEVHTPE